MEPLGARVLGETQGPHRVRDDVGVGVVLEPVLLEERARALHPLAPVASDELRAGNPLRRILGVEVEGEPLDRRAEPLAHPLGQHLTDAAERSDVVRPDNHAVLDHGDRLLAC